MGKGTARSACKLRLPRVISAGILLLGVIYSATVGADSRADFELRITNELKTQNPAAAALLIQANGARLKNDHLSAASLYGRVYQLVPSFVHALRRQCWEVAITSGRAKALPLCREAISKDSSAENLAVLSAVILSTGPGELLSHVESNEALELAAKAAELETNDSFVYSILCKAGMAANSLRALMLGIEGLERVAPNDIETQRFKIILAVVENHFEDAEQILQRARSLGMSEADYQQTREYIWRGSPYGYRTAVKVLFGVAFWFVILVLVAWLLIRIRSKDKPLPVIISVDLEGTMAEPKDQAAHSYSKSEHRPRRAFLAAVANLVPPLGHVYAGKPLRGVVLIVALILIHIALVLTLWPLGPSTFVLMLLIGVIEFAVPMADVVLVTRRSGNEYRLKPYNRWYVYLLVVAIVGIGGKTTKAIVHSQLGQAYLIPAASMTPTLIVGDHILTDKTAYKSRSPKRFELVVYEFPEDRRKTFVHRIIGLPGETIEIRDKKLFINGTELTEPHANFSATRDEQAVAMQDSFGPFRIPLHSFFVLGDNRNRSYDSRFWGPVSREKIYGSVKFIYFSWDSEKSAVRWGRIGKIVEQ